MLSLYACTPYQIKKQECKDFNCLVFVCFVNYPNLTMYIYWKCIYSSPKIEKYVTRVYGKS